MTTFAHGETVTVMRSTPTVDRYGNEIPGPWASTAVYDGCGVAPRTSSEDTTAGRQGVIVGLTVFLPPDADIGPHDRLEVRGETHEIEGEPGVWRSPFTGWAPGIAVATKRVEG